MVGRRRDVPLATKLHVPCPQPGFIPRPRLVEALAEGLARRLILVCAPAGPGKTALLADWVRGGDRPVAWLSLDAADADPALLERLPAALHPALASRSDPPGWRARRAPGPRCRYRRSGPGCGSA